MAYDQELAFSYSQTARVVFGVRTRREAGVELKALGCERALLCTDRFLREKTDLAADLEKTLGSRLAAVFDGVVADTSVESIDAGAALARDCGADSIVSLGGWSAMDTAKGIGVVMALGGSIRDHQGTQFMGLSRTPHVAIPTTAGTGSEVSVYCVVKDHAAHEKMHYLDTGMIPQVAILDPEVTVGMPSWLTAATGFDALTHAIEAYTSLGRNPMTDAQALYAVRMIGEFLPQAVANGTDLVARGQMLLASNIAGAAMSNAGVGLVHAIAHVVGAKYGVHHGTANAIALPHVIRFNQDVLADRYQDVARALGAGNAADACALLLKQCGLPQRYRDTQVPEAALSDLAEAATCDGAIVYNGKFALDRDVVLGVLQKAW